MLARAAVLWNAGFNLLKDVLQFGITMILARLLSEQDYGQFSFVTGVIGFLILFSCQPFFAHLLQVKDANDADFQRHFTLGVRLNIGVFFIANLVAFTLRYFPQWAEASPYIHAMSLMFLLDAPCELRRKMIERQFDWKKLRILQSIGLLINLVAALGMAWAGWGAYALLLPALGVQVPFIYDLFISKKWRPTWEFDAPSHKPAIDFGITRIGSGLSSSGRSLLETAVLVSFLGFGGLGLMNRAIGLAQLCCLKIASQLVYSTYPLLTRAEETPENAGRIAGLVLQGISWFTIPTAVVFAMLALPVIRVVYGESWLAAVSLVPWAMAWGFAAAFVHACYSLLLAKNHVRLCFLSDITSLGLSAAVLYLALPYGVIPYIMATTGVQVLIACALLGVLTRKRIVKWSAVGRALIPPVVCSALASLVAWSLHQALFSAQLTSFWPAMFWGVVFLIVFTIVLRNLFGRSLANLMVYLPGGHILSKVLLLRCV
jgi:O-antigen/teichoic acid export membrane protein